MKLTNGVWVVSLLLLSSCGGGSGGGSSSNNNTGGTTPAVPQWCCAYVAGRSDHMLWAYTINSATGALTPLSGYPIASSGFGPFKVAISPNKKLAFVPTFNTNRVWDYQILSSGALSSNGAFTVIGIGDVAFEPTGKFVYVPSSSNNVYAYTYNDSTGPVTSVQGSPFAAGFMPRYITFDPAGKFAYVINAGFIYSDISTFAIDPVTGALSSVANSSPGSFSVGTIKVHPLGQFAYVTDHTNNAIAIASVDPNTGALAPAAASVSLGFSATDLAIDFTGEFALVGGNNGVSVYRINTTTGGLTLMPGSPVSSGNGPNFVTTEPRGKFVYVVNVGANNISVFNLNTSTGALTAASGSPFATGQGPFELTVGIIP